MKILARHPDSHHRYVPGAIVELSGEEFEILTAAKTRDEFRDMTAGTTVEIVDGFRHAMWVLQKTSTALSVPGILRSLADTVEVSFPKLEAMTEVPPKKTGE